MSIISQLKKKRRCRTWKKAFHFDEVQFTCFFSGSCLWCLLIYSMDTKIYCHVSFKIFIILVFAFRFMSDFVLILCWCKVGVQLHSLACSSHAILLKINGASLSQKGYRTQGNPDWVIGSRARQVRRVLRIGLRCYMMRRAAVWAPSWTAGHGAWALLVSSQHVCDMPRGLHLWRVLPAGSPPQRGVLLIKSEIS